MVQTAWRILIAEDDVDLNNGITFYFNSQGYKCLQAFDGAQALELFENNIVSDIELAFLLRTGYSASSSLIVASVERFVPPT